ncbi:methyltransferase domain protein [Ceratobasidium sp. AG-Ba]|nr:methyltransferase domain protein [Ceratobasidium sp. AG-Ba]QRW10704.1 methyltransferase domain protein [Ceratobasidium sp. AG-Ba]
MSQPYIGLTTESDPIYFVDDVTDYDPSDMDTASSVETSSTMSTLESGEVHSYFREVHGRMFPADTNVPMLMPTDSMEVRRLEKQHLSLKLMLEGNYFGPMREVLAPEPGRRKRVLDLVTVEGCWVQEVAREFPEVDFVSIDSTPLRPHQPCPNVLFEVYDLYNGFAEPDESFDVVHVRHAVVPMKNVKSLVREVHRVLRPGGLLLFCEYELEVYDALFPDIPAWGTLPGISNALRLARGGLATQGVNVYAWRDLPRWLPYDSPFWKEHELESDEYLTDGSTDTEGEDEDRSITQSPSPGLPRFDHATRRGFVGVQTRANLVPAAPWPDDPRLREVGSLVQEVWSDVWRSMGSSLQVQGLSAQEANETIRAAVHDIQHPSVRICAKLHTLFAFKVDPFGGVEDRGERTRQESRI